MKKIEFISAKEAACLIEDNSVCAVEGFIGACVPEEIYKEIEQRYLKEQQPKGLTIIFVAGQGDTKGRGIDHICYEGLIQKAIGGHWKLAPILGKLAIDNKIQAYNLPQGVISQLFRDIAAGKPGLISHVGLETFVDPKIEGGKINDITSTDIVHDIILKGHRYLFYDTFKIDYAILRGTYADEDGNITFDKEALTLEALAMAMAAKNSGGKVIVQVEKTVKGKTFDPKLVQIPGVFVDYIVISENIENHMQTFTESYNEDFVKPGIPDKTCIKDFDLGIKKLIARRAAMFLTKEDYVLNYGYGLPGYVSMVLMEEDIADNFMATVESGSIGGVPLGGLNFGCSLNPQALIDQPYQFDFYNGGGIDITFLGLAQIDKFGNVNVSRFNNILAGCGGFIDISQNAKKVIYCGTFTTGGLEVEIRDDGNLKIIKEGKLKKFVKDVEQITFSGKWAVKKNKPVIYVTERAVFKLTSAGLELIEYAPGIDIERDILKHMEFMPIISKNIKKMDTIIFNKKPMGLKSIL